MIASAITRAIERKELNKAIDALKKMKAAIVPALPDATAKLAGVTRSIKDGSYRLDDKHILIKTSDGSYTVIETAAANVLLLSSEPKEEILFLSA